MKTLGRDSPAGPSTDSKGLAERFGRSRAVDNKSGRAAGNGPQSGHGRSRLWSPDSALIDGLRGSGAKFRLANGAIATRLALPVANPAQRWQGYAIRPICRSVLSVVVGEEITQTDDREHQPQHEQHEGAEQNQKNELDETFHGQSSSLKQRSICFSRSSSS